ncbi:MULTISPECIES: hypothetical protein [Streptomyces]|uniref:Uncharacterized protein n=1 Tax=Streptomyces cyaneofuscatus TaxID=66883 RepID=A0ABZ1EV00_9ACTN|nr:hypothetical protein [Streptomyces cyaneofuscatus]WSB07977.1 hypothetical protein OG849_12310 [Streptomyces cyaneofuscatus]WSD48490.1 hypothetical protein OG857_23095 [Streptomyces cyaneofuscatus]WTA91899.1 hypothetical protein OG323_24260 [Streptomyces cyaneofuscatus]
MISEPELIGDFGPEHTAETVGDVDRKPAPGRRRGHGLLWGAAGALIASAVWATAVFAYGDGVTRTPDARGYRVDGRSCSAMQLKALTASVGKREDAPALAPGRIEHPALHRVRCFIGLASEEGAETYAQGWSVYAHVGLTVELYKETDPRSEFEAREGPSALTDGEETRPELVPNLGDRAYLLVEDGEGTRLSVLDGAVVLTLTVSAAMNRAESAADEEPDEWPDGPAPESFHADMISDMRDVMEKLKTA